MTRRENEFRVRLAVAMLEDHIAAGTVEQLSQNVRRSCWSILTEDAFIYDTPGNLHAGVMGDLAKNLVEAGVLSGDRQHTVPKGDARGLRRALHWGERNLWLLRHGRLRCGQGR